MTVKKRKTADGQSEDLQEVRPSMMTSSFRWALIILVASMHPIGRSVLGQMGFVLPDQASEKRLEEKVMKVEHDVAEVKKDVAAVKEDVKDVSTKVTGFQVDFERFKREPKQ